MKLKTILGIIISLFLLCNFAMAEIIFTDDGSENYTSKGWEWMGGTISNATDPHGSNTVYHMVKPPDVKRAEFVFYGGSGDGYLNYETDFWFKYDFFLPSDWTLPPSGPDGQWCTIGQWHVYPDICDNADCYDSSCQWDKSNGEPFITYLNQSSDGQFYFKMGTTYQLDACDTSRPWNNGPTAESPKFSKGSWHTLIFNVRFSYRGTGYNKAWLDGTQFMNATGVNNSFNDEHPPYFQLGIYPGANGAQSEVYLKNIVVARNSSFAEVNGAAASGGTSEATLMPPILRVVPN